MSLIKWENSYSVGVSEFDQHHQQLVGMINELYDAMRAGTTKGKLDSLLKKLFDYTKFHFQKEEQFMQKHSFRELSAHQRQHQEFIKQLEQFKERYDSGSIMLSNDVFKFLKNWLMTHIVQTDKGYSACGK